MAFQFKLRRMQRTRRSDIAIRYRDLVGQYRSFAVNRHPGGSFLRRWTAEQIQSQVMTHDSGKQFAFGVGAILGMLRQTISGRLNGWPRRQPQRPDTRCLVQDFGDVTALLRNTDAEFVVLQLGGAAIMKSRPSHLRNLFLGRKPAGVTRLPSG